MSFLFLSDADINAVNVRQCTLLKISHIISHTFKISFTIKKRAVMILKQNSQNGNKSAT